MGCMQVEVIRSTRRRKTIHAVERNGVVRLSIPIHGNRPLKIGLLRHLAKLAGIADDELG